MSKTADAKIEKDLDEKFLTPDNIDLNENSPR